MFDLIKVWELYLYFPFINNSLSIYRMNTFANV
jgi:hypothetical protein